MKLLRLGIQQLPGIGPGFTVEDISPHVNLVTGPNASGKSSLLRALRYLVAEPDTSDPPTLSLNASFDEEGTRWTVVRTGRQQQWQRDGQPVERPPLPEGSALHCYWLTMEDLAVAGSGDRELVGQLRKALTGGYDLRGLRQALFQEAPRAGQAERRRLREARDELRRVESGYEALRDLERQLPELDEQIEEARQASEQAARLEQALALESALSERQRINAALGDFPPAMDALRGNEAEQLDRLDARCRELQAEEEEIRQRLAAAEQSLGETGLAAARPSETDLEATRTQLEELRHWQQRLQVVETELAQNQRSEEQAWAALAGKAQTLPAELPRISPDQLSEAERLAGSLEKNRLAMDQLSADKADNREDVPDKETIRRHWHGVDALENWLATVTSRATLRRLRPGLWAGVTGALVALVLSALGQGWWVAVASGIGLCGVLWSLYIQAGNPEAVARESYRNLDLPLPEEWDVNAVRTLLETLRRDVNVMERRRDRELAERGEQERWQALEEEAGRLARKREQLADGLGFDPAWEAAGIQRYLQLVMRYEQAHQQRQDRQIEKQQLQSRIDDTSASVADFLGRWQAAEPADWHDLVAAFQALSRRVRQAEEAARSIGELRERLDQNREQLSSRWEELEAVYRSAGLESGDRRALDRCLERLEEWRSLQRELQELQGREREPRRQLANHPQLLRAAESGERERLERQCDECLDRGGQLDSLRERKSDIRGQLQSAGQELPLEKALHRVDREKSAFADRLQEQLSAEAGRFLLDGVEQEHQSEHEPEVLREARALFGRFTHQAWDISVGEADLMARDRALGEVRPLAALSSGTRMQLLLAVRLAWTRRLESGRKALPLFLDEALTTSDESRFAEVAESLEILCREEGRQVFYLSARQQESALWEQVTGRAPHRIDMAALRFGQAETGVEDYIVPPAQEVPEPGGESDESYAARLGVPPVDPDRSAGALHIFHLLRDDLLLLYRLMSEWRVTSLGQLEGLLGSDSGVAAIQDDMARKRMAERCATARQWQRAWYQGRNRSVDNIVLQRAEPVSDRFLEEVSERARQEGGDPQALIVALRDRERKVSGFGPARVSALEEWLEQEGYITPGEPLTAEQRLQHVLHGLGERHDPRDAGQLLQWLEAGVAASD